MFVFFMSDFVHIFGDLWNFERDFGIGRTIGMKVMDSSAYSRVRWKVEN